MSLSIDRAEYVRRALNEGRFSSAFEMVDAALRLLEGHSGSAIMAREVALGLEQALAGRSDCISYDEFARRILQGVRRE